MRNGKTLGLPLRCPKCPSKHYFGVLKGDTVPTDLVKIGRPAPNKVWPETDVCPNCSTPLVPGIPKPARITRPHVGY